MRSKTWATRRARYFRTHKKLCRACGASKSIHLHHVTYERLGRERNADLVALCRFCHEAVHELHRARRPKVTLRQATTLVIRRVSKDPRFVLD
jgi:5-methylcytosine-specific restriction endonuclease McrA